jgi:hypothetical protein
LEINNIEKNFNDIKNKDDDEKKEMILNEETPRDDDSYNNIINYENGIKNLDIINTNYDFEIINMEDFYKILTDEK